MAKSESTWRSRSQYHCKKVKQKVKEIKVEGEWEKEKEVIVRHEIVSPKWKT